MQHPGVRDRQPDAVSLGGDRAAAEAGTQKVLAEAKQGEAARHAGGETLQGSTAGEAKGFLALLMQERGRGRTITLTAGRRQLDSCHAEETTSTTAQNAEPAETRKVGCAHL